MLKSAALTLAMLAMLTGAADAGERYRDRYAAPPPPAPGANRYYGPVNNYYGPVTVYAAPDGGGYAAAPAYPANTYPAYGSSYSYGYATAPECDANCYGAGYDWSHGYGYGYGYGGGYGSGYAYPAYGYGGGNYPSSQPVAPWGGYNGGFGNGYW